MPHVDFDEQAAAAPVPSDATFTLGGRVWTCRDRLDIPGGVTIEHLNANAALLTNPDDEKAITRAAVASEAFCRAVVMPEEGDAFVEMLSSKDVKLTGRTTLAVFRMLLEHALARPTTPAGRSSTGRKPAARKSTAGSSSPGTRRRASAG